MVNRVAVIFCVYLCAAHQVYSGILTNYKTEAGVISLLKMRAYFLFVDYDDDHILTHGDFLRFLLIDDLNDDGEVTYEEVEKSHPNDTRIPSRIFNTWDANLDRVLNKKDIVMLFEELPGSGNELDLQEILTIASSRTNETTGPVMKIQSFVQAERDFLIIDENDDNILTKKEFQVEFKVADKNKDGKLEESEVRNMFPMRSTPPEKICPNIAVSCSVEDIMSLFDAADQNKDSQLSINEYIIHFGFLIKN
ncbi:hypothetical protein LOTGIDRAFT_229390 [Lottia gigantea]|uniref:EF-hand domain-containing protein n=1 Tax=Lottia gigantea TaxID=225164 RepID=V4BEK3_LOTGI|nr:hypothetical protein LOTGIDRAFT_229390 [Lottia gigantea]ESO87324.1 hypothetical protein LOTGIDRAFT_229390 [Lottia gigantea]